MGQVIPRLLMVYTISNSYTHTQTNTQTILDNLNCVNSQAEEDHIFRKNILLLKVTFKNYVYMCVPVHVEMPQWKRKQTQKRTLIHLELQWTIIVRTGHYQGCKSTYNLG